MHNNHFASKQLELLGRAAKNDRKARQLLDAVTLAVETHKQTGDGHDEPAILLASGCRGHSWVLVLDEDPRSVSRAFATLVRWAAIGQPRLPPAVAARLIRDLFRLARRRRS